VIIVTDDNQTPLDYPSLVQALKGGKTLFFHHKKTVVAAKLLGQLYIEASPPQLSPEVLDCLAILAKILPIDSVLEASYDIPIKDVR